MQRRSRIVRAIWAVCLLLGALNHARILVRHGLDWDYGGVGAGSAIYWTSLTVIDPAVAALLFLRPRIGVPLTVVLITTNVVHNVAVTTLAARDAAERMVWLLSPQILAQLAFMLFVIASVRTALPTDRSPQATRRT